MLPSNETKREVVQWSDPAGGDDEETRRKRSVDWREVGRSGWCLKRRYMCGGKNDILKTGTGTDFSSTLNSRKLGAATVCC